MKKEKLDELRKLNPATKEQLEIFERNKEWILKELTEEEEFKRYIDDNMVVYDDDYEHYDEKYGSDVDPYYEIQELTLAEEEQKQLYEKLKKEYPNYKKEYEQKDIKESKIFYREFKRLGGNHDFETYRKNLKIFFRIILDDTSGNFESGGECYQGWIGYIGNTIDARIYYQSVDNIHPIS